MMTCQLPTLFLGILSPQVPNRAQKSNQGSIRAYSFFRLVLVTSLIGAFFKHIFPDTGHKGLESEIASFEGRKTGLIIPFWLADRRSGGLWG
jgi:hypothetical protein